MLQTPCYVIGDAHLGVAPPDAEQALLAFLRTLPGKARSLVIMGDLFDFWFAWNHAMPRTGFRVLAALADLHDAGITILWIAGNHDCWGGEALMEETGVTYSVLPWQDQIGPWRTRLEHGDGLRVREDAPYRRLRSLLRHPLAIRVFSWLHPNWSTRIAVASSNTSRHRRAGDEGRGLLAVATSQLTNTNDLQLVIHGHSHVPSLQAAGAGYYANAGAWYLDRQYLRITDEHIVRHAWIDAQAAAPSIEGDVLDVIHRSAEESPTE